MATRGNIFETLGRVSVLFSTLEAELGGLLCLLAHKEEPLVAATLLEGIAFSRIIDLLEKIAPFKDLELEVRITRLLEIVSPLRKRRNPFARSMESTRIGGAGHQVL